MSQRPSPPSTRSPADQLRQQMERSIDELAMLARTDVEARQFFTEVLRRALEPGGASRAVLWRLATSGDWELAGALPSDPAAIDIPQDQQTLFCEIAQSNLSTVIGPRGADSDPALHVSQVYIPLRHAGQVVGILEIRHSDLQGKSLSPVNDPYFAAIGEIAADYLSQQELLQLRLAKTQWLKWDQFSLQVGKSLELTDVSLVISNDGRRVVECDRICVLTRRGNQFQLQTASGTERANPRSGSVRSLESLAAEIARHTGPIWRTLDPTEPINNSEKFDPLVESLDRYARSTGVACFGAIAVMANGSPTAPAAILTFERFQPGEDWSAQESNAVRLVQRSSAVLVASIERNEIPWAGVWRALQHGPRVLRRPTTLAVLLGLVIAVVALVCIPAEFTVTGHGEIWPRQRRDVFARTAGIIDQVLVEHGDEVRADQPLLVVRDPDLDQDAPKVAGEIATTQERLRGLQLARLAGTANPEASQRLRQLTAEEEELKERLKTLERQRTLIEQRQNGLTLRSPLTGRVLTWSVHQLLSARPVERGQSLLTIGETSGPWVVEIQVADKDAGPLIRAHSKSDTGLDVDFQLPAEPGTVYRGRVLEIAPASESSDRGLGQVRVIVEFDKSQVEQLRPGATAIPRIRCGRQSLGYVWLHDLIDTIRMRVLF